MSEKNSQILIYERAQAKEVVRFRFDEEAETIWATVEEMANVFEVDRSVVSRHVRNIYNSGELKESATCAISAQVQEEGGRLVTRKVKRYNLDMIISVGYRVNSAKATRFRIWANKVLHDYIVRGVAVNERRVAELPSEKLVALEGTMSLVRRLMERNELSAGEANGVLEVIAKYAESFREIKAYEQKKIVRLSHNFQQKKNFGAVEVSRIVDELRSSEGEEEIFGKVEDEATYKKVLAIFAGDAQNSVPRAAAELLYIVAKEQPFYDGNKRIAALLFIVYLTFNDFDLAKNGETKISDRALTALTLLMGESENSERELMINLVEKLLR